MLSSIFCRLLVLVPYVGKPSTRRHTSTVDYFFISPAPEAKVDGDHTKQQRAPSPSVAAHTPATKEKLPVVSHVTLQASQRVDYGVKDSFFLRFENVKLSNNTITVYYDPNTFTPPTKFYSVDLFHNHYTVPRLPTFIDAGIGVKDIPR